MKVDCKIYKGIEYVQLNELPETQREELLQTMAHNFFIKIMIDGKIVTQCLQYKDYDAWYEGVFKTRLAVAAAKEARVPETLEIKPNLALNKF